MDTRREKKICIGCEKPFYYVTRAQVPKIFCPSCVKLRNADSKRRSQEKRQTEEKVDHAAVRRKLDEIPESRGANWDDVFNKIDRDTT